MRDLLSLQAASRPLPPGWAALLQSIWIKPLCKVSGCYLSQRTHNNYPKQCWMSSTPFHNPSLMHATEYHTRGILSLTLNFWVFHHQKETPAHSCRSGLSPSSKEIQGWKQQAFIVEHTVGFLWLLQNKQVTAVSSAASDTSSNYIATIFVCILGFCDWHAVGNKIFRRQQKVLVLGLTLYRICVYPASKSWYWVCKNSVTAVRFATTLFLQGGCG